MTQPEKTADVEGVGLPDLLYGRLVIHPYGSRRVTWEIHVGINSERHDINLIGSQWAYMSEASAKIAAKRWAARLGVTLVE